MIWCKTPLPNRRSLMSYVAPTHAADAFNCPNCGAYAHMRWYGVTAPSYGPLAFSVAACQKCGHTSLWKKVKGSDPYMLDPAVASGPTAHVDMPEDCREDYEEARAIAARSPRGAAALQRLVVQKLCVALGQAGKNINDDIKALVQNGLPVDAQQALDVLRVTGNNAVHPGEMDFVGNPSLVTASFDLINFIVDQQITQKKRIANLFAALPAGAKAAIARRDGT